MAAWTAAAIIYICEDPRRDGAEYRAGDPERRQGAVDDDRAIAEIRIIPT